MDMKLLTTLALAVTCLVAGCGSDAGSTTSSTKTTGSTAATAPTDTTAPDAASTTSTAAPGNVDCSAAGSALRVSNTADLPAPVAKTHDEIASAAATCDYEALQAIIDRHPEQFQFQVGAGATSQSAADYWKSIDAKEHIMLRLTQLIATRSAVLVEGTATTHVWPAVHAGKRTDTDWQDLIESGAYTEQEVAAFRKDDLYFGYRVGILPDGTWSYFVAGD
ncbi:MAG: hypothetical protein H7287_01960 [Thermoleophilia bacterium]|nr:hypothetical protein [Thermoleophilia bacterium]